MAELADALLSLPELPMAWMHRLSTSLTAESAARLRTTCKLLQRVVDATWEPDEPVAPHKRSVPLTWEQVKAQLPPHKPWKPEWVEKAKQFNGGELRLWDVAPLGRYALDYEAYEDLEPQDGCDPYWLEVFGPALTRLTANQAVNMLQGKPVLGIVFPVFSDLSTYSTAIERMHEVSELTFSPEDLSGVQWSPRLARLQPRLQGSSSVYESEGEGEDESEGGTAAGSDGGCGSDSEGWWPTASCLCRGEAGWGDGDIWDEGVFDGVYRVPSPLREEWVDKRWADKPHEIGVVTREDLLATTDSSCRRATPEEVQQFVASDSPDDADKFDLYLSTHNRSGVMDLYVFLGPVELRLTGRPKAFGPVTASPPVPAGSAAAGGGAAAAVAGVSQAFQGLDV